MAKRATEFTHLIVAKPDASFVSGPSHHGQRTGFAQVCAALVHVTATELRRREVKNAYDMISAYGTVVNVNEIDKAAERLTAIAT